jgi:predicted ATPase
MLVRYTGAEPAVADRVVIRTPDQRVRVFVSSTLAELADERAAARRAVEQLRMAPVMFELGARPHPPRALYRAYLDQSHIFVGIYWERYGWVAPGEDVSGLEDEYRLSGDRPKLIYLKSPAPGRESRLKELLDGLRDDDMASYKSFSTPEELQRLLVDDLVLLLTERFEMTLPAPTATEPAAEPAPAEQRAELEPRTAGGAQSLPAPATPLVGRLPEVLAVVDLLTSGDTRLVTMTGPGGIGKSRLAIAIGEHVGDKFPDGVAFVPLAPITDSELVTGAVAHAVGVSETPGTPLLSGVTQHLRGQRRLLILDNFEHVLDAAAVVSTLVGECPTLHLLVTSRAPLRLSGEREYPVPPLSLPGAGESAEQALDRSDALRLFVDRARAVKPDFMLTEDNLPAVTEICLRLDGLPLALELAAARARLLPPQALLGRLGKRLTILTGGARDLPRRQQTLRATIDWSYGLLDEEAKQLLARLSVFRGGRSLDAVEAVCDPDGQADLLGALESLVENSLVQQVEEGSGEARFLMLETIHEYAAERLADSADADRFHRSHAEYYLALVERAEPEFHGPGQMAWLERLDAELDNLRAALAWSIEAGELELGLRLAGASLTFWDVRGVPSEGLSWLDALLAHGAATAPAAGAKALFAAGFLHADLEQLDLAERDFRAARGLYGDLGDRQGLSSALNGLGVTACYREDFPSAKSYFEQSLALRRELADSRGVASCLTNLTLVALCQDEDDLAAEYLAEGLPLARRVGDPQMIALHLANAMILDLRRGRVREARSVQLESLDLAVQLGDVYGVASGIEGAAVLAGAAGDQRLVARLWGAAAVLREEAGRPLLAPDRRLVQPAADAARAQLGQQEWDAEQARGARLSRDEAVEEARLSLGP